MEETDKTKLTFKDWLTFIMFTIVILFIGFMGGVSIGRNHPSATALDKELTEIDAEVKKLKRAYDENREQLELGIEIRDSIIYALKRELAKGDDAEIPIKVNINLVNDDNK